MPVEFDWTVSLSFLLTLVAMIYAWWRTRDQNTDGRFKAGSERMDRHEARLNSMEQTMRGLPQKEDMHQLQLSVERMSGKLDTMSAVIDGNNKVMERLEDVVDRQESFLLGQRK